MKGSRGSKSPAYHLEMVLQRDFFSPALSLPLGEKITVFPNRKVVFSIPILTRRGLFFIRKSFIAIALENPPKYLETEKTNRKRFIRLNFVESKNLLPLLSAQDKKMARLN